MPVDRQEGIPGGLRGLTARIRLAGRCTEYVSGRCGAAAVVGLVERTTEGKDYDGNSFQDFSTRPGYFGYGSESANRAARKRLVDHGQLGRLARRRRASDPLKRSLARAASRHRQSTRILSGGQARAAGARSHAGAAARRSASPHYYPGGYKQYKLGRGYSYPENIETGRMLGAMGFSRPFGVTERGANYVVISWIDPEMKQRAQSVSETRPFFAYGRIEPERERIQRIAQIAVGDQFRHVLETGSLPTAGGADEEPEGSP